ncbi:MAG: ATP synthase subunit I [Burkholderiales bacterium]|nr:ATP synthase subunit I [Burkholderiales bacterium]MDE2564219.1 ATP synthase subunit I [Burkholderiales bacterium]
MQPTAIERPTRHGRPAWGSGRGSSGSVGKRAGGEARLAGADDWEAGDGPAEAWQPLTREQAQALRIAQPPLSPWRVVRWQAAVGCGVALLAALLGGRPGDFASALYGAVVVVVPGALMARGMTSRLSSLSPGASAVSVMGWSSVKIAVSVALLVLAPRIVQPLVWPALLAALVLCLNVYGLALLWRPGRKTKN